MQMQSDGASKSLSEDLTAAFHCGKDRVEVGQVFDHASSRGFGFLFVLFALPIALPITPPGVPVPFGILLTIGFIQLISGRSTPYIPKWIAKRKLPAGDKSTFVKWLLALVRFLERLTKYRPMGIFGRRRLRYGIGPIGLLFAIAIINPVSQVTWLPAIGVLLIGMALLESDGLMAIFGMIIGTIGLFAIGALVYGIRFGAEQLMEEEALRMLLHFI